MFRTALPALATILAAVCTSAGAAATPVPLNNLVTQLADVPMTGDAESVEFTNPRAGWVFLRVVKPGAVEPQARLDGAETPVVWRRHPVTADLEAMARLAAGGHRLRVDGTKGLRLDVRAIPEISYCYYPTKPHIGSYGPYDWAFMERYVLPDVNTIVTRAEVNAEEFAQWVREGRQWLSNASLPGLSSETPPAADDVYKYWSENAAVTQPGFGGLIVDEFIGASAGHYAAWADAWERLHANPRFKDKIFYAWCGNMWDAPGSLAFAKQLLARGDLFVWEQYLREGHDERAARKRIAVECADDLARWKKEVPGVEKRLVLCLGYLSAPPETLNLHATVDYHVYLDMQFHTIANDPGYAGLYGVMEYMADYADEESLRYAQKLFRHYCIEGRTERLNRDPYELPHLKNPDFDNGLRHWRIEPAGKGTIEARTMAGFSWLQGRYPRTKQGDTFCWMKRGEKPNRVSQTLRQLTPGRRYSVKVIAADPAALDVQKTTPVTIGIENGPMAEGLAFSFAYPSCYSHEIGAYTKDHPAWFTLHRAVFTASGTTAELTISDTGGGGAETAFNFVEAQPFVED